MAASLTNATTNTNGTSITVNKSGYTVTLTGTIKLPDQVYLEYSTDNSTWVKTGLVFSLPGVTNVELRAETGHVRAVLKKVSNNTTNVSVDIA